MKNYMMIDTKEDIEKIFNLKYLDQDCDYIAHLMQPFQARIYSYLEIGNHVSAIELFLQLLASQPTIS